MNTQTLNEVIEQSEFSIVKLMPFANCRIRTTLTISKDGKFETITRSNTLCYEGSQGQFFCNVDGNNYPVYPNSEVDKIQIGWD